MIRIIDDAEDRSAVGSTGQRGRTWLAAAITFSSLEVVTYVATLVADDGRGEFGHSEFDLWLRVVLAAGAVATLVGVVELARRRVGVLVGVALSALTTVVALVLYLVSQGS